MYLILKGDEPRNVNHNMTEYEDMANSSLPPPPQKWLNFLTLDPVSLKCMNSNCI